MKNEIKIDYILQHLTSLLTRDTDQILLEQLGVGYSQYKILRILIINRPVKQKFIADNLGQTEASISRQIDLLIKMGLVSKYKDPRNLRARLILLTTKGKKITDACNKVLSNYYKNVYADFNLKNQNQLIVLLEKLHDKICSNSHSIESDYISYLTDN